MPPVRLAVTVRGGGFVMTPLMPELLKLAVTCGQFCERRPAGRCEARDERPLIPKTIADGVRAASRDAGVFASPSPGNRRDVFAQ